MPIYREFTIKNGLEVGYFQFGKTGKRYYYIPSSKKSKKEAYLKCLSQSRAIKANQN